MATWFLRTYVIPPDYSGEGSGQVEIVIEEGDSGTAIAEKLHQAGVIASVRAFTNEIRFSEINFVPGTYRLRLGMSAEAAVELLLDPESRISLNVTIPEGLRAEQILDRLAEQTGIPREEFQEAYDDHDSLNLPDYATQGPEGYLFPETYEFDRSASAADILQQMVEQYWRVAAEVDLENRAEEAGFDPNEIMAIASIVQAESGKIEDMARLPGLSTTVWTTACISRWIAPAFTLSASTASRSTGSSRIGAVTTRPATTPTSTKDSRSALLSAPVKMPLKRRLTQRKDRGCTS